MPADEIHYSERYEDKDFEYRHVMLPGDLSKYVPKNHNLTETEWRNIGVQQSSGWVHYMTHNREQHVLCFRRPHNRIDPLKPINANIARAGMCSCLPFDDHNVKAAFSCK